MSMSTIPTEGTNKVAALKILTIIILNIIFISNPVYCNDSVSFTASTPKNGEIFPTIISGRSPMGINYPWLNYGHDFGTTAWGHDGVSSIESKKQIDADFSRLKSHGIHIVRWFLFGDCRASPEFDAKGKITGFDEYMYADLEAAIEISRKYDIYLIMVLFDFKMAEKSRNINGVQSGGHSQIISDIEIRQTFLENALKPLLERYGNDSNIIAWDIINEPEGCMLIPGGRWVEEPVSVVDMQSFIDDVVDYIHTYSSQYATVGSANRGGLEYWTASKLDFYQFHYYEEMEYVYPLDYPYVDLNLSKPCIVGEYPTNKTERSMEQYIDTIWKNGYSEALAWSYRADDNYSNFSRIAGEFAFQQYSNEAHI